jgi:hypothetical protein
MQGLKDKLKHLKSIAENTREAEAIIQKEIKRLEDKVRRQKGK